MDAATNVESLSFSFDGLSRTQYTIRYHRADHEARGLDAGTRHQPARPPLALRPAVALKESRCRMCLAARYPELLLLGLSRTSQAADASRPGKLDVLQVRPRAQGPQLVGVRGAGLAYDGLYYVTSVTHDIKRGEYKQSSRWPAMA